MCTDSQAAARAQLALQDSRQRIVPALVSIDTDPLHSALLHAESAMFDGDVSRSRESVVDLKAVLGDLRSGAVANGPDLDVILLAVLHLEQLVY